MADGASRTAQDQGESGQDEDKRVRLLWVLEKDYAPLEHGELAYDPARDLLTPEPENPILAQQARAFIDSYLAGLGRRSSKAAGKGQRTA